MFKPKVIQYRKEDRIEILDVLRGFAICFILFNNILYFSGYEYIPASQRNLFGSVDDMIHKVGDFFITAKFYTMFALLFGMGFYLQLRSFQDITLFKKVYRKRLFALLGFGLIHGLFLWSGDILLLYSLSGFGLLLTINKKTGTLFYWSLALLTLVNVVGIILLLFFPGNDNHTISSVALVTDPAYLNYPDMKGTAVLEQLNSLNGPRLFQINLHNLGWKWASYLLTFRPFTILGLFILGYYLMRISFLQTILPRPGFLVISGIVGISSTLLSQHIGVSFLQFPSSWENESSKILDLAGHLGMCFFYMSLICRICMWNAGKKICSFFVAIGKMALSCYILQSILCISIFYFGRIAGRVPLWQIMLIALAVNTVIGLFASTWIKKYKAGPLETLWRKIYQ